VPETDRTGTTVRPYKDVPIVHIVEHLIPPWIRNVLHPLAVGLMVGCIAFSIAELAHVFFPDWNGTYLLIAPIIAALMSHYSYRLARQRFVSGIDLFYFWLIEMVVLFIVVKVTQYLVTPWPEVWLDIRNLQQDPYSFFDIETLVAFGLAFSAWQAVLVTARDLEDVGDPLIVMAGENPLENLSRRFFIGGIILLIVTGIARIGFADLFNTSRPPVPGLVLSVLIYFLLGIVMLGQIRFSTLVKAWTYERIKISDTLASRWLLYSVIFLGLMMLVAFVLPSGYAVGFLDLVRIILFSVNQIIMLILFLLLFPFTWLLSLFGVESEIGRAPEIAPVPLTTPGQTAAAAPMSWLDMLKSLLFWALVIGTLFFIMRSYLRDRPELVQGLQKLQRKHFRFIKWLRTLWIKLKTWWQELSRTVATYVPRVSFRARRREGQEEVSSRRIGRSSRDRVFYYYLNVLDRARQEGVPRRSSQTPYEYRGVLLPNLPEVHQEVTALTQAFVEARYSQHPVAAEELERLRTDWKRIQDALASLEEDSEQALE